MVQLDILRGVAILLVLGAHPAVDDQKAALLRPVATLWRRFGWTGVDLFFVLSGFLIGGLLFAELRSRHRVDVWRFVIRRGLKIWPGYLALLAYLFLMRAGLGGMFGGRSTPERARGMFVSLLPNLLHVQNYFGTPRIHTWSLAVEEHFYLLLPLALWLMTRRLQRPIVAIRAVPIAAAVLVGACTISRCLAQYFGDARHDQLVYQTQFRVDGLFLGVFIAYLYHFQHGFLASIARHKPALLCAAGLLLGCEGLAAWFSWPLYVTVGLTMLYLGYGCVLVVLVFSPPGSGRIGAWCGGRAGRLLASVGLYSYSIYLWHIDLGHDPAASVLGNAHVTGLSDTAQWAVVTAIYVVLAIIGGAVMSKLIELPALALRDRLFPRRASATETTP